MVWYRDVRKVIHNEGKLKFPLEIKINVNIKLKFCSWLFSDFGLIPLRVACCVFLLYPSSAPSYNTRTSCDTTLHTTSYYDHTIEERYSIVKESSLWKGAKKSKYKAYEGYGTAPNTHKNPQDFCITIYGIRIILRVEHFQTRIISTVVCVGDL